MPSDAVKIALKTESCARMCYRFSRAAVEFWAAGRTLSQARKMVQKD
jgi:hypothetical protein